MRIEGPRRRSEKEPNPMDGHRTTYRLAIVSLVGLLSGCSDRLPVDQLPTAQATLTEAGKRLSDRHSTQELTALARSGDRVLRELTGAERDALTRGGLRFTIDRPADVYVAIPERSTLFWLPDQGFSRTSLVLTTSET